MVLFQFAKIRKKYVKVIKNEYFRDYEFRVRSACDFANVRFAVD